ncbi:MAG: hypothetical protein AB1467_05325 [Candidatus Diapherotrites archaeon]
MNVRFMDLNAQISVEFIIVLVVIFFLFGFAFAVYLGQNEVSFYSKEALKAKRNAFALASVIDRINSSDFNSSTTVFLEPDFNFAVSNGSVEMHYRTNYVSVPLTTKNVSVGTSSNSTGKNFKVRKFSGGVLIEDS